MDNLGTTRLGNKNNLPVEIFPRPGV